MAVVMPKKRSEVVADRTRRLAREAIDGPSPDQVMRMEVGRRESEQELLSRPVSMCESEFELEAGGEEDQLGVAEGGDLAISAMEIEWPTPPTMTVADDAVEAEDTIKPELDQDDPVPTIENEGQYHHPEGPTITLVTTDDFDTESEPGQDESPVKPESDIVAGLLDEDELPSEVEISAHTPSIILVSQRAEVEGEVSESPILQPEGYMTRGASSFDSPTISIGPEDSASQYHRSPDSSHLVVEADVLAEDQESGAREGHEIAEAQVEEPSAELPPLPDKEGLAVEAASDGIELEDALPAPAPVPVMPTMIPSPPLPLTPRYGLRKQKSLKQLLSFGLPLSSTPPPPLPDRPLAHVTTATATDEVAASPTTTEPLGPQKRLGILSRQSKPSLRVDVKASKSLKRDGPKSAPTPTFSITSPDPGARADAGVDERPKMTKRFSLSNMSSAFKKMAGGSGSGAGGVPKVPELPEMYRRQKASEDEESTTSTGEVMRRRSEEVVMMSNIPLEVEVEERRGIRRAECTLDAALEITTLAIDTTATSSVSRPMVPIPRLVRAQSFSSLSSTATTAAHEQQTLISVSPRTQRDPSASLSLREYLSRGPSAEVVVTQLTQRAIHARQQSLEATIVLTSTPPPPLPRSRLMDREDSLGSLSRSSQGSNSSTDPSSSNESHTLQTPMVIPVSSMSLDEIRRHIPICQPRTMIFMESQVDLATVPIALPVATVGGVAIGSTESFHTLPSLGSEMIVVDSPTCTLASTSSGASGSRAASISTKGKASSSSSKASTPKARSLVRMITSHGKRYHNTASTSKASPPPPRPRSKGRSVPSPPHPAPPPSAENSSPASRPPTSATTAPKSEYDTLSQVVQLKSLHFEELDLDFSKLDW